METLSCHSKQTIELNFIKNIKPVKCNMVTISIESKPHRAYGFWVDDSLSVFSFFWFFFGILVSMATNKN